MINTANAKGILFSTAMVKAIREGRKTQTRRVCKTSERWVKKFELPKSRYEIGDILYVRETWAPCATIDSWLDDKNLYVYKANFPDDFKPHWKWRPSIFMPKEAARIWLEVTGARAERVQDITEQDARAEGCSAELKHLRTMEGVVYNGSTTAKQAFATLWDNINHNRGYGWDVNPWVWVYSFRDVSGEAKG